MPRYAAIDIGSNSLRMEAAEVTPEAIGLVCKVLGTMAQQYRKLDVIGVRAVATSAIRDASNQDEFLVKASEAIAAPVEIISGQEESRLIHLGVQSRWPHHKHRLLIIDVGGGSAEVIYSENGHMRDAVSKPLGAVRLTEEFLKSDPPADGELHRMQDYIEEKLASAMRRVGRRRWDRVIATSGTASAAVSAINHVSQAKVDKADRLRASAAQIRQLYEELSHRSLEERRKLTGIGPKRAEII